MVPCLVGSTGCFTKIIDGHFKVLVLGGYLFNLSFVFIYVLRWIVSIMDSSIVCANLFTDIW